MRRKPTFEELAGAALKKPVLAKPPPTYVPHNDNEVAVAQLRAMSDDLKNTQRRSQLTRAQAERIAEVVGGGVDDVIRMLEMQTMAPSFADMAATANAANDRADLLTQDNMMGQLQLQVRNNAQLGRVVQQVARALPAATPTPGLISLEDAARVAIQSDDNDLLIQSDGTDLPIPGDATDIDEDMGMAAGPVAEQETLIEASPITADEDDSYEAALEDSAQIMFNEAQAIDIQVQASKVKQVFTQAFAQMLQNKTRMFGTARKFYDAYYRSLLDSPQYGELSDHDQAF